MSEPLDTHQRALAVNLDTSSFGTLAEIGAGQEVARWFLQVGGAAGTVAKTISAYDMTFSDAIYGKSGRYVSRERLAAMLDHEYALLLERLDGARGADTRFFVFANTVAARNYAGTNECHGWLGIRFQTAPRTTSSQILLHVNMRDPTNLLQQQALGVLGVNLVYAAFFERESAERLLAALFSGLTLERIEIDTVDLSGPAFASIEPASLGPMLVRAGFANAVLYSEGGSLVQPSSVLRKRAIVLERGTFATIEPFHRELLDAGVRALGEQFGALDQAPLGVLELSVRPLLGKELTDEADVLRRVNALRALGASVLLTRYRETFRLTEYLRRTSEAPIGFSVGAATLIEIFEGRHYADLVGGLLEAMSKLLAARVRVYVYPMSASDVRQHLRRSGADLSKVSFPDGEIVSADTIRFAPPLSHLYAYLLEAGWIVPLAGARAASPR